ncbi:hypothetical protein QE152_g25895 [Popillia japonica]|uniref:Centrosomal protein of 135 kDa n=1 Tax=Popillia japonica TaxID=7064 RepID=A0AAW1JZ01_POPJA
MEDRYLNLRKQLEELGYHQYLKIECVPLVEKLVSDLIHTTESLRKYMKISKDAINERDNLLLGAEPYKCDNAKLVKECNELHLAFLQFREQHDKLQKDFKRRITLLEKQKIDSDLEKEKLITKLKSLELDLAHKNSKLLNSESSKLGLKPSLKTSTMSSLPRCKCCSKEKGNVQSLAEDKILTLMKDISKLKEERLELTEANLAYKDQINSRDKEIQRLVSLLEGGRPIQALNQDCCYKDVELKMSRMQDDIEIMQRSRKDLENRLKEAVIKQHEAMKRALTLAERNKVLEKEMRDIDQIALAVEADCNSTVKCNANKLYRLQERCHESVLQIQQLEKEVANLKRDKQELVSDYDVVKTEKRHLQSVLETALDEKKRLNDRLNQYSIIEHDLNMEIDRLVQTSTSQKQRIAELECRLLSNGEIPFEQPSPVKPKKKGKAGTTSPTKKKKKPAKRASPTNWVTADVSRVPDNTPASPAESTGKGSSPTPSRDVSPKYSLGNALPRTRRDFCDDPKTCVAELRNLIMDEIRNKDVCLSHLKEIIGNEFDHIQTRANMSLDHLKNERDYYMKECQNLMEKMRNMCNNKPSLDTDGSIARKLMEKEQLIATLEHENRQLSQEKHNLMTRLETSRDRIDNDTDVVSARSSLKRLERDRELLKADIQRLEEERDGMRHRLNTMAEHHLQEKARLEGMLKNSEEDVRKLEADRRDFMHTQGSRRATINNLQEECDMLRDQLRNCQSEFNQQRAYHAQLKTLHEQTDRALADCQSQLHQVEKEMFAVQERLKLTENEKEHATKEIFDLRNELTVLKGNLAKMDQEKDSLLHSLDDKTERIVALEEDLRKREMKISSLESSLADMRRKISVFTYSMQWLQEVVENYTKEYPF